MAFISEETAASNESEFNPTFNSTILPTEDPQRTNQENHQLPRVAQDHKAYLQSLAKNEGKAINVLSLDGGGIRGLLELFWLKELEERVGKPCIEIFDLFVGTSTGGIIATGLAAGYTVEELLDIYIGSEREEIFSKAQREIDELNPNIRLTDTLVNTLESPPKDFARSMREGMMQVCLEAEEEEKKPLKFISSFGFGHMNAKITTASFDWLTAKAVIYTDQYTDSLIENIKALYASKYAKRGMEDVLIRKFYDKNLSDLHKPVLITACELVAGSENEGNYNLFLFDSIEAQNTQELNFKIWEALRATSAAPTYFPPVELSYGDRKHILVDGGVLCNSPAYKGFCSS